MAEKATTSIFLDKYHPQKDGKCAVSIRVTYQRKKKYYPTIFRLSPEEFVKVFASERPREEAKKIKMQLNSLEKKAADIIKELPFFTWATFEKNFFTHRGNKNSLNFAYDDYIQKLKEQAQVGTAVTYECARTSLNKFKSNTLFADVTPAFLHKYEKWMLDDGCSLTTVSIYLRTLRTIFNMAIAGGTINKELYPFGKHKYEVPSGNNIKKALTLADISLIYNYEALPESTTEKAKNYWLFMYFCNGLNVKDLCLLKYSNIQGDILVFERAKTSRTKRRVEPIRVPLLDEAMAIIKKFGNKALSNDTYIFPVLTKGLNSERERQLIQQFTHVINDHLKIIAKKLRIEKDVTTYAARHSFATILKRSGASIEFISEALGHSNVKTTQNYLDSFEDESKKEMAKALTPFKR